MAEVKSSPQPEGVKVESGLSPVIVRTPPHRLAYNLSEAAQLLSMSRVSVYRLIERGLLKANGSLRHKRISHVELERFAAE